MKEALILKKTIIFLGQEMNERVRTESKLFEKQWIEGHCSRHAVCRLFKESTAMKKNNRNSPPLVYAAMMEVIFLLIIA